jgi:hypothetical protein
MKCPKGLIAIRYQGKLFDIMCFKRLESLEHDPKLHALGQEDCVGAPSLD